MTSLNLLAICVELSVVPAGKFIVPDPITLPQVKVVIITLLIVYWVAFPIVKISSMKRVTVERYSMDEEFRS